MKLKDQRDWHVRTCTVFTRNYQIDSEGRCRLFYYVNALSMSLNCLHFYPIKIILSIIIFGKKLPKCLKSLKRDNSFWYLISQSPRDMATTLPQPTLWLVDPSTSYTTRNAIRYKLPYDRNHMTKYSSLIGWCVIFKCCKWLEGVTWPKHALILVDLRLWTWILPHVFPK